MFSRLNINLSLAKIFSILLSIFLIVHIVSCLWYFIDKIGDFEDSWITQAVLQDAGDLVIYVSAMYWSFATIFTVGFGDIHPVNNIEKILCIFWMIFGAGFYSYTIGNLLTIIQNYDKKETLINLKLDQIDEFTSKIKLNTELSSKIKSFYEHKFSENFLYDNDNIINELPDDLLYRTIQTVFKSVINSFDIFHDVPRGFINKFILNFKALYLDDKNYTIYNIRERAEESILLA